MIIIYDPILKKKYFKMIVIKSFMTNLVATFVSVNVFAISIKKEKVTPGIHKLTIGKEDLGIVKRKGKVSSIGEFKSKRDVIENGTLSNDG